MNSIEKIDTIKPENLGNIVNLIKNQKAMLLKGFCVENFDDFENTPDKNDADVNFPMFNFEIFEAFKNGYCFFSPEGASFFNSIENIKTFDIKLDDNDIKILEKIANAEKIFIDKTNQAVNITENGHSISYRSPDISKTLFNLIDYAYEVQRPVRLHVDNNSSVILKVDTDGLVSAEFFSSNKSMEMAMRAGIVDLRNRFEEKDIPYKDLSYRERNNNKERQNKGDN